MTYLQRQIRNVGAVMDRIAGIPATYQRGTEQRSITCVPVRVRPSFLAEGVGIRMELQDFYLQREQLGDWTPQADDLILTADGTFQVLGGIQKVEGLPAVETLASDNQRVLIHTVRRKNHA